ncbi:hypothetical protein C8Q76DRAFT_790290 [Earliella scabrosa]|nr:hypothetical protein C8Q76DRAFT_790290 [Earliella scabrosa]
MPSPTQPAQSPRPPPADPASGNPTQLYPAYLFFLGEDKRYIPYKILTYNVRAPAATANHGNTRILATHLTPEQFSAEQEWEEYRCRRLTPIGYGIRCVWYRTCGPFSIPHPPAVAGAEVDDIFMHHDQTLQYSMWVVNRERRWVPARSGSRQPSNPEWRLWMRETGEPAWITKKTYSIYRSQQHADTRRKLRELDGVHR